MFRRLKSASTLFPRGCHFTTLHKWLQQDAQHGLPKNPVVAGATVGQYLMAHKSDFRKSVLVMLGAGVSVAAGIPDFRSKGTGLYATVKEKYGLDQPEQVFDLDYFQNEPGVFSRVCQDMGLWPDPARQPTAVHKMVKWLQDEHLLLRCYTQNIDGLEQQVGVRVENLVEAHGSFATASCSRCKRKLPSDGGIQQLRKVLESGKVMNCAECSSPVKPDVVFFGEQLPSRFFDLHYEDTAQCKMLLVLGTGLGVFPFSDVASLHGASRSQHQEGGALRVLCNKVEAGHGISLPFRFLSQSSRSRSGADPTETKFVGNDIFLPGDCQSVAERMSCGRR